MSQRGRFHTLVTWTRDSSALFPGSYPENCALWRVSSWFLFTCLYRLTRASVSTQRGEGSLEGSVMAGVHTDIGPRVARPGTEQRAEARGAAQTLSSCWGRVNGGRAAEPQRSGGGGPEPNVCNSRSRTPARLPGLSAVSGHLSPRPGQHTDQHDPGAPQCLARSGGGGEAALVSAALARPAFCPPCPLYFFI